MSQQRKGKLKVCWTSIHNRKQTFSCVLHAHSQFLCSLTRFRRGVSPLAPTLVTPLLPGGYDLSDSRTTRSWSEIVVDKHPGPQPAYIFGEEQNDYYLLLRYFQGRQNGCNVLLKLAIKHNFENFGGGQFPGCQPIGCGPAWTRAADDCIALNYWGKHKRKMAIRGIN